MDRSVQFDFMSILTRSSSLLTPIVLSEFCVHSHRTTATKTKPMAKKQAMCLFSHVWISSGILYILPSRWWWCCFFLSLSLSHCCCVIAVHHNPYCAYVVHPHCLRIHFISLLHSSLFVCLLSENFDFFLSLSLYVSSLTAPFFRGETCSSTQNSFM